MKHGQAVTVAIKAGLCDPKNHTRFVGSCEPGAVGTYQGKHPIKALARKGWHLVRVGELDAPLHASQFQANS